MVEDAPEELKNTNYNSAIFESDYIIVEL